MEDWVNIPLNYYEKSIHNDIHLENLKKNLKQEIMNEIKEDLKKEILNEIYMKNEQHKNLKLYYLTTGISIYKK